MKDRRTKSPLISKEFNRKVLVTVGIVMMAVLFTLLLLNGFRVVLLILAGILVAAFFLGIANFIQSKTPLTNKFSLLVSVLFVVGSMVGISFALAPNISHQVSSLEEQLPRAADETFNRIEATTLGSFVIKRVKDMDLQPDSGQIKQLFGSLGGTLSTVYIVVFLGIFFTVDPKAYLRGMVVLFPKTRRNRAREILVEMGHTLQKWLLGKLLSMLIVGVLTGVGLVLLGIPLALTLAIFAAVISFIPNFGPLLSLIPAFLLAFMESPTTAFYVVLLYIAVQALESNLLTPLIQKKMISLPMAIILIAQVSLGIFTGVLGVILAVPLVAILIVFIKKVYIEDLLSDYEYDNNYENQTGA
ncbi:AI-2E family transporter [Zobellia galactanivorans]|uniref:AI-2E family transporter n=1 Tax=Zobellia galactanivorans (strain DSM 12802 / CCUG 47099 / CIP 106680 / NCIMB 13871 / Dsij) TaxID=63186 RepID=UPI001C0700A8|nr:AI-2E family transporter [Zobellia galactanivorans]MBU3025237.1 AI-2E family transporter [Zobellia galactanivorans]